MEEGSVPVLGSGRVFVDLSDWRIVAVTGGGALSWLDALLTADLRGLRPGRARRSLLLSPTGQVRADMTVSIPDRDVLLLQDPRQPRAILDLLSPYVLSSDVELVDRTGELSVLAVPGGDDVPEVPGAHVATPSALGPGIDVIGAAEDHDRVVAHLAPTLRRAEEAEVEAWRIGIGSARLGVDVMPEDLPQEGGLEEAVSFDKGCFLGQEAVARVRNLGHPRRALVRLEGDEALSPGQPVFATDQEAGTVTSAAVDHGSSVALARIRWPLRDGPFRTGAGRPLRIRS
jgi:folate-binding protein YgfZ